MVTYYKLEAGADAIVATIISVAVLYLISVIISAPYTLLVMGIVFVLLITLFFIIEFDRDPIVPRIISKIISPSKPNTPKSK